MSRGLGVAACALVVVSCAAARPPSSLAPVASAEVVASGTTSVSTPQMTPPDEASAAPSLSAFASDTFAVESTQVAATPTPKPTTIAVPTARAFAASLPNDTPCPAIAGAQCYTFVVTDGAGVPLGSVCVVAGATTADPSTVACPDPHYATDATGTVRIGTLFGKAATFFFLYPGKTSIRMTVMGSGIRTVRMP